MSVKQYVNNFLVIQSNITDTKVKIARLSEHAAYLQNFRNPYLKTEQAIIFKSHQSNIPYNNGHIYKFDYSPIESSSDIQITTGDIITSIPHQGRSNFLKIKWNINSK